jgi:hypothetical protein
MPSLTSHINSRYVDAANRLRSGSHLRRRIVVYVESYDDISFWRDVLSEFQTPDREFQVMLPSRTSLSRGKKQAMANLLGESLGECMIACVDADYDYLMQGHTPYSQQLLSNRYIFHTYVYAIENFQCYAPSLHDVCTMATLNDRPSIDFEAYLQRYSEAVYDLFVWTVWLYRRQMYRDFPLNTFLNLIGFHPVDVFHPDRDFADLRHQCNRRVAHMQQRYPEARADFKQLKAELATLGVLPQNTYLFIQGHHLFENVVLSILDPVCTQLRREREREIKNLGGGHRQQTENELASYQHSQFGVDQMLRRNTRFKSSPLFQRLRADLQHFFDSLPAASPAAS